MPNREVLIVDDKPHELFWLTKILKEEHGCTIQHLANEKDAKDHLDFLVEGDRMPYALGIIDIMIPVAKLEDLFEIDDNFLEKSRNTGLRVCRHIRQKLKITANTLPLIAISARGDNELIDQLQEIDICFFSRDDQNIKDHLQEILTQK